MTLRYATTSGFNNNFSSGIYGMNDYYSQGFGMPYGYGYPMYGGMTKTPEGEQMTPIEYREYTDNEMDGYKVGRTAKDSVLVMRMSNICSYIAEGKEDFAMAEYQSLLAEMKEQERYQDLSDGELQAIVQNLIQQELGGDLEAFIRENARDAKGVERQQKMYGADKVDSTSQEDLLEAMCGIKDHKESMTWLDNIGYGFEWFFNPWERWFAGDRVD